MFWDKFWEMIRDKFLKMYMDKYWAIVKDKFYEMMRNKCREHQEIVRRSSGNFRRSPESGFASFLLPQIFSN